MFQNVIIGQYVPGQSLLHQMDPRSKLISVFLFVCIVFLANDWMTYGILVSFATLVILLSQIPLRFIWKGMLPILILIIFTFLLHVLFTKEGDILYTIGFISIYDGGLQQGIMISLRLFLLVIMTALVTLTTTPIDLTDGLEYLLSPFKKFGLPAHEIALMMSIAIRFIPTLLQETEKIIKAQAARGVDFRKGTLKQKGQAILSLMVPLFIRAFKRAEDLALAMEARGFRGGEGRTKYRLLSWSIKDTFAIVSVMVVGILLLSFRYIV